MESFRKLIRGWLGKVLLVLFLLPLALAGMESLFGTGSNKDGVAKTVNDLEISDKDLEAQIKNYKDQYLSMVQGDESLLNQSYIAEAALDSLVNRALLIQQAEKLGITLSDAQIEQMIAQQPSLQVDGVFSKTAYENYLRSIGMTSQALIANLRQDHALKILSSMITDNSLVSKVDIQQISNLQSEQRSLLLSSVKLDAYKNQVKVTDQDITAFYNKHSQKFKQLAAVDVDYVVVSPALFGSQNQVTDAELKQAYDQFVQTQKKNAKVEVHHILITTDARKPAEAEKLANDIYAKIQAGMNFADAAKQYSEDPTSKNVGGLVEAYTAGAFGEDFDKAVAAANNTISKPVKTQFGYHIISAKPEAVTIPSFESEKARLTAEVLKTKNANVYTDTVNRLNEDVVNNDALDVVTQELKTVKIETAKAVTLGTTNPVLSDPNVKTKLFSDDVKNGDRNASSNIQLANGDTVWFKVRQYHAAGVQPLAQVKAKVKEQLIDQKAYDLAKAKIATMLNDFNKLPAQQVLSKYPQSFENAGVFTRSQGLKREIERAAFSVPAPKEGMWSVTTAALPNEMVVVAVASVKNASVDSLSAEKNQELLKLYQNYRGNQMLEDYTNYLKSQAKIK
ncbi:peptidylprolyl isomerase [Acinetobacter sp. 194]|uniref:SurA N-terminal domain-containing protein n=1 Tax=Acinetobacter shaoyimingii TaxID=2715164 RepID=UPI001408F148|nr:SurA N-terminal domain-containing protein [Acinetobacter shaoyimingii]NHB57420.1 peptidylprolyl isomerase [Acinetobacter shaoyimingii]